MEQWMRNMTKKQQNYISLLGLVRSALEELDEFLARFIFKNLKPELDKEYKNYPNSILRDIYESAVTTGYELEGVKIYCENFPKEHKIKYIKELDENKVREFFKKELFDNNITEFSPSFLIDELLMLMLEYERLNGLSS